MIWKAKMDEFTKVAEPMIQWLRNNCHPHMKVLIDCDSAELLEAQLRILKEFDEGSSSEGSDGGVEQACCLNCGTDKERAYIYCEHFQKVMEMKSFDETGETTACSKWTNAERNGRCGPSRS